jgi:hypothetical protein
MWQEFVALLALIGVFNIATGCVFFFFPHKLKMSKVAQSNYNPIRPVEEIVQSKSSKRQEVAISLTNFSLQVQKVSPLRVAHKEIRLLHQISTTFEPGKLNLIM